MLEQGDLSSVAVEWDKPEYWDEQALDKELRRQYDVCNSCRLCFNLCPGFPKLFGSFDQDEVDSDPDKLTKDQVWEFVDLCYNCKLCFIKCPYTPPHKFLIDIPKLVMRARAVEVKENGLDLRERMLSSPDEVGPIASKVAPLANFANNNRVNRVLMEKTIGIHRDKILPKFHAETFERWFKKNIGQAQLVSTASGSERAGELVSTASGSERAGELVSTASGSERAGELVSTASGSERAGELVSTASGSERAGELVSTASGSERAGELVSTASGSERAGELVSTASGSERAGELVSTASGSERAGELVSTASGSERAGESNLKVALFHTCIVNYNEPQIGKAAVRVLQKNEVEVCDPQGQRCCGMPYLDAGRVEEALDHFRDNVKTLLPYARQGYDIVVPEPTCGMMLKKEYADYLQGEERDQALEVSKRVYDLSEYLVKLNNEGRLSKDFKVNVGKVAYHQPCHLKYQAIGAKSIELLRLAGAQVIFIDKGCSGHDGTWAMKKEYFDLAQRVARGLHRGVNESNADMVATDCSLAGLQIEQGTGRKTIHPIEVLAKAYGIEAER